MPTNKSPSLPPSPPRAPFFEPDANLTLTSIIRSALSKLVVSSPTFPGAPESTSLLPPHPHPRHPPGNTGKARRSRTGPAKLTGRFVQARARTHARTRPRTRPTPHPETSPVDCLIHPPPRWPADLVPCSHPRAGVADAALWVPEGPGGSDDPPLPHPDCAKWTHTHERK